ncbi:RICIN domain-containing protein [Phreatobacter cathodiphilus]|uniref:RICIN domain-containing protein n=1 Tax=Phreatobacter cathodiphilus TaxID=1868589 RepID=UPI0015E73FF1|nr:RICIN domain-containing protein [Phreatobacter cathodiphilus]
MRYGHLVVVLAGLAASSPARAQVEPWGGNVPGWTFSQGAEARNAVNCRAVQGSTVISRVSTGRTYLSVPAPANLPVGRYTEGRASVVVGGQAEPVDADRQSGGRLLFFIDAGLYPALTRARGFQWRVSGPGGGIVSGSVGLSGDVGQAIAELGRCLAANRSAAAPSPQPPRPVQPQGQSGGVVSLFSQSEGGLCLGAAAGMLNIGLVTECRKPPARLRIDAAARRIRLGDQPNLCLSFAVGTFAQINDLMVAPCDRITVDLVYDRASMQIRSPQGNVCVGAEGGLRDFAKLKMQPCSASAPGQRWVLNAPIAAPLARP